MEELTVNAKAVGADGVMDVRCQIDGLSFLVCGTAYKWSPAERAKREAEEKIKREAELKEQQEAVARAKREAKERAKWQEENKSQNNELSDDDFIDIACPKCGEMLSFLKNETKGICPECGAEFEI